MLLLRPVCYHGKRPADLRDRLAARPTARNCREYRRVVAPCSCHDDTCVSHWYSLARRRHIVPYDRRDRCRFVRCVLFVLLRSVNERGPYVELVD